MNRISQFIAVCGERDSKRKWRKIRLAEGKGFSGLCNGGFVREWSALFKISSLLTN
jgi:hypothetical protein